MDWQVLLKTVAPWIGTAIGGPLGGMALTAAASALGLSDKTTEGLKAALGGATPEQMQALQAADQQFQLDMQKLGFQHIEAIEALAVEDRKDARAMQIATRSWVPAALACTITVGFLGILLGLMRGWLKANNESEQYLLLLLGSLATSWGAVVNYFFGSSAGSARKDELAAGAKPKD